MNRRYCSTYMQLFWLDSFADLGLLQPINITDINNQPHLWLHDKDSRLGNVSRIMSNVWRKEIKTKKLWELRQNKELPNQKSKDKKMEWYDLGKLEFVIAGVDYIYTTFVK